ncbi:MAG: hypothetical protein ABL997_20330 [Planctomycetota bacterium]
MKAVTVRPLAILAIGTVILAVAAWLVLRHGPHPVSVPSTGALAETKSGVEGNPATGGVGETVLLEQRSRVDLPGFGGNLQSVAMSILGHDLFRSIWGGVAPVVCKVAHSDMKESGEGFVEVVCVEGADAIYMKNDHEYRLLVNNNNALRTFGVVAVPGALRPGAVHHMIVSWGFGRYSLVLLGDAR